MTQTPRADGILVIIRAGNCGACLAAEAAGLFDRIEAEVNIGEQGRIATIKMDAMGPTNEAAIFNLINSFPKFMYILARDFDRVRNSGANAASVINLVRFFNYRYNAVTREIEDTKPELLFNVKNLQNFCDSSMLELLSAGIDKKQQAQSETQAPKLVARYRREYS